MVNLHRRLRSGLAATVILWSLTCGVFAQPAAMEGRELFMDPSKGNCAACHRIPGDSFVIGKSRMGPELAGINGRFPDRLTLRAVIWDLSTKMPGTIMPPYGKYRILTEAEIDAIVRYLETF